MQSCQHGPETQKILVESRPRRIKAGLRANGGTIQCHYSVDTVIMCIVNV